MLVFLQNFGGIIVKTFLYLCLLLIPFYTQASTVAITENDPQSIVEGVSVITGDFCVKEDDIEH